MSMHRSELSIPAFERSLRREIEYLENLASIQPERSAVFQVVAEAISDPLRKMQVPLGKRSNMVVIGDQT